MIGSMKSQVVWFRWVSGVVILSGLVMTTVGAIAQKTPDCPAPALSRMKKHRVASGETLDSIANRYNLIPATLMGINPALRSGKAPVGTEILVPPFNGIRLELQAGQTWRDVAQQYGIRPDILFEVNGCQTNPRVVFVPGVNWSPAKPATTATKPTPKVLAGYPLTTIPSPNAVLLAYGWGVPPKGGAVAFHAGVDLSAPMGTSVLAVGDGVVAFAGNQEGYGKLIVINHAEGLQTRYAQLGGIKVNPGDSVKQGQAIATVGNSGSPSSSVPHLHFEVRSRSNVGWVAEDPNTYLPNIPKKTPARRPD
jgi:lysostaphin